MRKNDFRGQADVGLKRNQSRTQHHTELCAEEQIDSCFRVAVMSVFSSETSSDEKKHVKNHMKTSLLEILKQLDTLIVNKQK